VDSIVRHLVKKNPSLTKEEAEKKAREIWENYKSANKEMLDKREKEHQEALNRSINDELGGLATELRYNGELKGDELKDYLGDNPVEIWDPVKKEWILKE
tara:strand:+ start:353 stop:652 length:300 start_codon:yes stop_codon:yes gene_type:complete